MSLYEVKCCRVLVLGRVGLGRGQEKWIESTSTSTPHFPKRTTLEEERGLTNHLTNLPAMQQQSQPLLPHARIVRNGREVREGILSAGDGLEERVGRAAEAEALVR